MAEANNSERRPTPRQRPVLEARASRLDRAEFASQIRGAREAMGGVVPPADLVIRNGYSYRDAVPVLGSSDRKAPPREQRPPATRLGTSRGAALRFHLMLLALAQARRRVGGPARLSEFGFTVDGAAGHIGWADFIVSDATNTKGRAGYSTARNKRGRAVRSALGRMKGVGLVDTGHTTRVDDFVLLNECGIEAIGESEEYRVPLPGTGTFTIPAGFIEQGWVHVLEDSEIALLLMIACGKGALRDGPYVAIPGDERLTHYGIHRDPFSKARKTLEWCGLLEVTEVGRNSDGTAEDKELFLHRFKLVPEALDLPAVETMVTALRRQISSP